MTLEELTERSTEDVARARADRIRAGIHNYLETLAEIALAWERRDWAALGYADWQTYVDGEFGAARLKLPPEHRQQAVAELRLAGMSQRAIGTALGVDQATVKRDIDRAGDASASPADIRGADGKTYAASRPRSPAKTTDVSVWVAAARKGIEAHYLESADITICGRSTRTGLTMLLSQAEQRYEVVRCMRCAPLDITWVAPGDTASAGPSAEAHDPRASQREAGAERRDSAPAGTPTETAAGVGNAPADGAATASVDETPASPVVHAEDAAAPAPAPPSATSPVAGGAGVTPAEGLTVEQIARLRAVFDWARGSLARHPRSSGNGRRVPRALGMSYAPNERTARAPRDYCNKPQQQRVAHVGVSWQPDGEMEVTYRSERYVLADVRILAPGVDEGLDILCALGVVPDRFSRQYAAGVQAGMRAGDAIDGEWTEGTPA